MLNSCLQQGFFPTEWKNANITPIHKKEDKQIKSNYRPVSLLPCLSKVFERIVFKILYQYCLINNLLTERNSGFKPLDSTVNQLIHITHHIYKALDKGHDVCMIFLDVSRAFDKVWYDGLLFKLQRLGIEGPLLDWFRSYLQNRKQRVVINGQNSDWKSPLAGVPQGSILGPLLFLIYINDIVDDVESMIYLFADDTSITEPITHPDHTFEKLNRDLTRLADWATQWLVTFNASKTVYMVISKKTNRVNYPSLKLSDTTLKEVSNFKHLGLTLTNTMSWNEHIKTITCKANKRITVLKRIQRLVPRHVLETLFTSMIRPVLEYGDVIFDCCTLEQEKLIEKVQRDAAIACTGAYRRTHHEDLLEELSWAPLKTRRHVHRLVVSYKMKNNLVPPYLANLFPQPISNTAPYSFRNPGKLAHQKCRTTYYLKSFLPATVRDWNNHPEQICNAVSLASFKSQTFKLLYPNKNKLFSLSQGTGSIHQARMRMNLSGLNFHRFQYHLITFKNCALCGYIKEDSLHFLLYCPCFHEHRKVMLKEITDILAPGCYFTLLLDLDSKYLLSILLKGSTNLDHNNNSEIFSSVQKYIISTGRF